MPRDIAVASMTYISTSRGRLVISAIHQHPWWSAVSFTLLMVSHSAPLLTYLVSLSVCATLPSPHFRIIFELLLQNDAIQKIIRKTTSVFLTKWFQKTVELSVWSPTLVSLGWAGFSIAATMLGCWSRSPRYSFIRNLIPQILNFLSPPLPPSP